MTIPALSVETDMDDGEFIGAILLVMLILGILIWPIVFILHPLG